MEERKCSALSQQNFVYRSSALSPTLEYEEM